MRIMRIRTALLQEPAFVALITAAMEVYQKETFGLVIGQAHKDTVTISNALVYQECSRKVSEVNVQQRRDRMIRQVINELTNCQILGDFHSHSYYPNHLSRQDRKDMIQDGERISVLVVIKPAKQATSWHYDKKEMSIQGSLDNEYHIMIKVYAREPGTRLIRRLRILCPYLRKLNHRRSME